MRKLWDSSLISPSVKTTLPVPGTYIIITITNALLTKHLNSAGGVVMSGHNGKITVDNTLGARLDIAKEEVSVIYYYCLFY